MSDLERNLPQTLRERMNDEEEIFIFRNWLRHYWSDTMETSLAIHPIYDKESSQFVQTLETQ